MIVCTNGSNLTGNYVDPEPVGDTGKRTGDRICSGCLPDSWRISD